MTRRDFELVARVLAGDAVIPHPRVGRTSVRPSCVFKSNAAHAAFAGMMADALATTNERFSRERFVMAAMPAWMVGTRHETAWERQARTA